MKINKVILSPFAGIEHKEISFGQGINIVFGENETGKSTISNAITKTLFTKSKLTKTQFRNEINNFIPIGGDFALVEIEFYVNASTYKLKRRWGTNNYSEFQFPDGTKLSDEDTIESKLKNIIPFNEAVFKEILFTHQNTLSKTTDSVENIKVNFNDLLRSSILESGGVSIDEFRAKLEEKEKLILGKWDLEKRAPENNRGIENPWKKGVGKITESYYEKEKIKKKYDNAVQIEEEYQDLLKKKSKLEKEFEQLDDYIKANKEIVEDARKKVQLEYKISTNDNEWKKLNQSYKDWILKDDRIEKLPKEIESINNSLEELENEKQARKEIDENKNQLERLKRLRDLKTKRDEAKKNLDRKTKISEKDKSNIDSIKASLNKIETQIEASTLHINIEAKREIEFAAKLGIAEGEEIRLNKSENWQRIGSGKFSFENDDIKLSVTPGGLNFDELQQKYSELETKYSNALQEYNAKDYEDLKNKFDDYNNALNEFNNAEQNFSDELGEDSFEELEKNAADPKDQNGDQQIREMSIIAEDIAEKKQELKNKKDELEDSQKTVEKYINEYINQDELSAKLGDISKQKKDLQNEMNELKEVPETYKDENEFITDFDNKVNRKEALKEELYDIKISKNDLESQLLDSSSQELYEIFKQKEEEFLKEEKKGKALRHIINEVEKLREEIDQDIYTDYENDIINNISSLSQDKYNKVKIEDAVPKSLINVNGKEIGNELLSAGTKDILGLAIRLAMGKYYLKDQDGVLVMDDPLVDLDPNRQKAASDLLKNLSNEKQLIIFTCHPSHANQLGENQIKLENE